MGQHLIIAWYWRPGLSLYLWSHKRMVSWASFSVYLGTRKAKNGDVIQEDPNVHVRIRKFDLAYKLWSKLWVHLKYIVQQMANVTDRQTDSHSNNVCTTMTVDGRSGHNESGCKIHSRGHGHPKIDIA